MRQPVACSNDKQVKIVVTEHGDGRLAQAFHPAQHGERIGTAIDEIADEP